MNHADALHELFGPTICSVTRADLLRDGQLIAASEELARSVGFIAPVAFTSAVHGRIIAWSDETAEDTGLVLDPDGRMRDVLWMASRAVDAYAQDPASAKELKERPVVRVPFVVQAITADGDSDGDGGIEAATIDLHAVLGPDDEGDLCVTIMYPSED